jgi:hypothetical protein
MYDNSMENKNIYWIAPLVAMGIGLLPMPYTYYTLSRLVVCVCAIYFALNFFRNKKINLVWLFGAVAVLYNPINQVRLGEQSLWMIANIITAIIFLKNKRLLSADWSWTWH